MNTTNLEAIDKVLGTNESAAQPAEPAPQAAPEVVEKPVERELTYEERVQKNIETGHDGVKLHQEMLGKYGNKLSPEVMGGIIKRVEERTRDKISKPDSGYDPNQYANVIRTDVFDLADQIVNSKAASEELRAREKELDHFNAMAEFGSKNMHKKDEALKWYSEKMGMPLELLNVDTAEKRSTIYEAYNKGAGRTTEMTANEIVTNFAKYIKGE